MNNAGNSAIFADSQGWLEPFRVFFDRAFPQAFSSALELSDGDEGAAAQACAFAFSRAYSRWTVLGRIGDGESFVRRRLARGLTRRNATVINLEPGVGFKPWVYVTATEAGATRKQVVRLSGGVAVAAMTLVIAVSALGAEPSNDVSITGNSGQTPASSTPAPIPTTSAAPSTSLPSATTTEAPEVDWSGFTLNLSDLPTSPADLASGTN